LNRSYLYLGLGSKFWKLINQEDLLSYDSIGKSDVDLQNFAQFHQTPPARTDVFSHNHPNLYVISLSNGYFYTTTPTIQKTKTVKPLSMLNTDGRVFPILYFFFTNPSIMLPNPYVLAR
jgi:hypothetical protein